MVGLLLLYCWVLLIVMRLLIKSIIIIFIVLIVIVFLMCIDVFVGFRRWFYVGFSLRVMKLFFMGVVLIVVLSWVDLNFVIGYEKNFL